MLKHALLLTILMLAISYGESKKLRVAVAEQPPFIEKPENEPHRGLLIDLMDKIANLLNLTYEVYQVDDNEMGSMKHNKKWDGLVGELVEKRADIALAPLVVMADRAAYIDFTVPFYDPVGSTILMRKKEPSNDWFLFLKVFQPPVWGAIVACYFLTSLLLWAFERYSPHSYRNNKELYGFDPEARDFTLKECLWFCLMCWSPQGGGEPPKNTSGRFVAAAWWLFGFFLFATLTANYAAMLFVPQLETPIRSIDDLSQQYKIQYAPVNGSPTALYFQRMSRIEELFYNYWVSLSFNESLSPEERADLEVWEYPVSDKYGNIWRHMQEAGLPESHKEAIERVEASPNPAEGFAFVGDAAIIRFTTMTNCEVEEIGEEFSMKLYALGLQKGDPLTNNISSAILKLRNQRSLEQLKQKWWDNHPDRVECPKEKEESDGISLADLTGIIIIILACILIFWIVLVVEYCYERHKRSSTAPMDMNPPIETVDSILEKKNGKSISSIGTELTLEDKEEKEDKEDKE